MAENTTAAPPKKIPIGTPKVGIHPRTKAVTASVALSFGRLLVLSPLSLNSVNLDRLFVVDVYAYMLLGERFGRNLSVCDHIEQRSDRVLTTSLTLE